MNVRYYNLTNLETGEVRQHVESREVKKDSEYRPCYKSVR